VTWSAAWAGVAETSAVPVNSEIAAARPSPRFAIDRCKSIPYPVRSLAQDPARMDRRRVTIAGISNFNNSAANGNDDMALSVFPSVHYPVMQITA
jgi:hypothetical protein